MATRKKNTQKKSALAIVFRYIFLVFILTILGFGIYQYRDGIAYYLGFKSKYNTKKERTFSAARIVEIVATHQKQVIGFDISEYQEKIEWQKINSDSTSYPVHFVFVRATAGNNKIDSKFNYNWQKAKEYSFIRGAYHYYRPNENSLEQAKLFCKTVKLKKGDFPPVLDIEQLPKIQSLENLKKGLQKWLDYVEKYYSIKPIIYTGEKYYIDFLKEDFAEYDFWVANYNFWRKSYDKNWSFWQFSDKAQIKGIHGNVDINVYNGNLKQLKSITISE